MKEPKIRFKGFEGEWKAQNLSDHNFSIIAGGDVDKKLLQNNGKYPVIANALTNDGILGYYMDSYRVDGPAVTITGRGDIGVAIARHYSFTPVVRLLSIKSNHNVDFLANAINCYKVAKESTGVPQLTTAKLQEYCIAMPKNMDEEDAIAFYFTSLDTQISASTSRLDSLKQMKAASLQAMFPQEGETVPKVRFKGFEGVWKKVKLSECLEISTERNLNNKYGVNEVLSVSDEEGVMNQIKLLGRSYAGKSVTNYKILRTNQVVYTKSPLKAKPYGIVKVNKGETGIVSVLYAVYDAKECVSPDYIHYYFEPTFRINNYLLPLINKGAKNTMNISDEVSLQGDIILPNTLEEQLRIVEYLQTLDRQIALHAQLLEKLKQIKAACLDKMFV